MTGCCKECRHWTDMPRNICVDIPDGMKVCALTHYLGVEPEHKGTLAYAIDAENHYAGLVTLPTFACNQFQPKEQTPLLDPDSTARQKMLDQSREGM